MSTAVTPPNDPGNTSGSGTGAHAPTGNRHPQTDDRPGFDRRDVVARQKEEFGGMKFGAAFFGWLAATGMAVLLTAIAAAIGAQVGASQNVNASDATTGNLQTAGIVGGVILLVIILIAYFCGGYVAGRMARFNGVKQGVAVWLWAIVVAVVLAIIGAIAGSRFDILSRVNGLPNIPMGSNATTAGILVGVGVVVVSLIGAVLGGLAGMRFHRRVDKVGLDH